MAELLVVAMNTRSGENIGSKDQELPALWLNAKLCKSVLDSKHNVRGPDRACNSSGNKTFLHSPHRTTEAYIGLCRQALFPEVHYNPRGGNGESQ